MSRFLALSLLLLVMGYGFSAQAQSAFDDPVDEEEVIQQEATSTTSKGLAPVEEEINAGDITVGSTAQVVVLFNNGSREVINFKEVNLYPSSNVTATVASNACAQEALTPGAECAVIISVKGVAAGPLRTTVLMQHSGVKRLVTATISGDVVPTETDQQDEGPVLADLEIIPGTIDFGSLQQSRPLIRSATIKNISTDTLTIKDVNIDASQQSGFSFKHNCDVLKQSEVCLVTIVWAPVLDGPASGSLVIEHTGPAKTGFIPLEGEFNSTSTIAASVFPSALPGKGLLISDVTEFSFGTSVNSASARTATIVNAGDSPLNISDVSITGSENGLVVDPNGCRSGTTLQPTEACALTVKWNPTRPGNIIDSVMIAHDGARGVFVMPITGGASELSQKENQAIIASTGGGLMVSDGTGNMTAVTGEETTEGLSGEEGYSSDEDINSQLESLKDIPIPAGMVGGSLSIKEKAPILDSYVITSHSPKRAILSGPGGTRVVSDGKTLYLGGVRWLINVIPEGLEFISGKDKVLMIFNDSLSSESLIETITRPSNSGEINSGGGGNAAPAPAPEPEDPTAP